MFVPPLATPTVPRASTKRTAAAPASTPPRTAISPPNPIGYAPAGAATDLPTTGLDISGMLTLGVTLVVAGVVLVIVRRQRDKPVRRPEPSDWY
jgi:LPXTG-motif cell wall-anchored protein